MHPRTFREFDRICAARGAGGRVLEIGAMPSANTLLCMTSIANATERVGLNLDGPHAGQGFTILKGNSNEMRDFSDGSFDVVLCNAVLEHDRFFWKTVAEIRRVTKPGGLVVLGAPGYTQFPSGARAAGVKHFLTKAFSRFTVFDRVSWLLKSTPTIEIHNAPGDYYRFTPQSFREVLLEGMVDVEVHAFMFPPIIVGAGLKPCSKVG